MVCYDRTIFDNQESEGAKKMIEKIIFKVVQMKFLAMHITNKKLSFDIFMVQISSWNMILISNEFWHKRKMYNFDPYNVFLAITTNIPVLLMTVLQGHIYVFLLLEKKTKTFDTEWPQKDSEAEQVIAFWLKNSKHNFLCNNVTLSISPWAY